MPLIDTIFWSVYLSKAWEGHYHTYHNLAFPLCYLLYVL
jgi:hypothetical protein